MPSLSPVDSPVPPAHFGAVPRRGTQSMVGVMAYVWTHPSLTALELLWRWAVSVPLLGLAAYFLWPTLRAVPVDSAGLASMTFFDPVRSVAILSRQLRLYLPACLAVARWWVPLALLAWALAAAWGRTAVLRRSEGGSFRSQPGLMFRSSLVRAAAFAVLLWLWLQGLILGVRWSVIAPARAGSEPHLVLLTGLAVGITMMAFLAWSLLVPSLDLPPLLAMTGLSLSGEQRRDLRSKLIETNLVMGIVRVILVVMAMTLSASPLPFQNQQTEGFIHLWWVGVAIVYVLGSDFAHVVRRVTYVRLLKSLAA